MQVSEFVTHSLQRVKVYRLNGEGTWDDKGTGNVSVEYLEHADAMGMVVISEEDRDRTLLIHRIGSGEIYQRQGEDTIITWSDTEIGTEIALSFQEQSGCDQIWDKIQLVQSKFDRRHQENGQRRRVPISDEFDQAPHQDVGDYPDSSASGPVVLPPPDLEHLAELAKVLSELTTFQKDGAAGQMIADGWIRKLLDCFRICEDLENTESLNHLYTIVKHAIMLTGDSQLLDKLTSEENVMDVVGALEYEPDVPEHMRVRHREFLRDQAHFKEVVPIEDQKLRDKIHQTYRLGYLKDVILPRVLDDNTFATLHSVMLFNHVEVLNGLRQHARFLPDLFQRLREGQPGEEGWRDAVGLLQDISTQARYLTLSVRADMYKALSELGIFDVLSSVLTCGDDAMRSRGTDFLHNFVTHDALPLRNHIMKDNSLLGVLLQPFLEGGDPGIQEQTLEMLKVLLDPDTSRDGPPEHDKFLDLFYTSHMDQLMGIVNNCNQRDAAGKLPDATALGHIIELWIFCINCHAFRIKYYVLRNNLAEKVLKLLHRREKWLVIAAVRFLRGCLSGKDDFYNRYLIRNNLFDDVVELFLQNGDRYNLLNSALLDIFEFIRKENLKSLIQHVMERHGERLDTVEYVDTFKNLRIKYEQNKEREADEKSGGTGDAPPAEAANRRRRDDREMEKAEEDYFDREDDDEENDRDKAGGAEAGPPEPPPQAPPSKEEPPLANGRVSPDRQIGPALPPALSALVEYGEDDDDDDDKEDKDDGSSGGKDTEKVRRGSEAAFAAAKRSRVEDGPVVPAQPLKQGTVSGPWRAL